MKSFGECERRSRQGAREEQGQRAGRKSIQAFRSFELKIVRKRDTRRRQGAKGEQGQRAVRERTNWGKQISY